MENPHPLGQVGPNPLPRNPSPASQSVAVCTRTMLRILMNSASTRVTPSISSKKVKLNAHVDHTGSWKVLIKLHVTRIGVAILQNAVLYVLVSFLLSCILVVL